MTNPRVCESEFVVKSELGLHARPASQFVSMAGRFRASIHVGRGGEWVDGRSILSLLSLAAGRGTTLRIRAEGEDADEASSRSAGPLSNPPADTGTSEAAGAIAVAWPPDGASASGPGGVRLANARSRRAKYSSGSEARLAGDAPKAAAGPSASLGASRTAGDGWNDESSS